MYKRNIIMMALVLSVFAWGNPFESENPFAVDKNIKKIQQEEDALLQALKKEQESMGDEEDILSESNASDAASDSEVNSSGDVKKSEEIENDKKEAANSDLPNQSGKDEELESEKEQQFALAEKRRKEIEKQTLDRLLQEQKKIRAQRIAEVEEEKARESVSAAPVSNTAERNEASEKQTESDLLPVKTKKASKKKRNTKKKRHHKKRRTHKKKKLEKENSASQKPAEEKEAVDTPENVNDSAKKQKTAAEVLQEAIRSTDN